MPSRLFNPAGTLPTTAASQRLMNSDATESMRGSSPASMRRSMPRSQASAAASYWAQENSSVTFTGTPAKMASSIAGSPSGVPGIFTNRFGRSACLWICNASVIVPAVSLASSGDTSIDTQPSTPAVRSNSGRNRSAARRRSSSASSTNSASLQTPAFVFEAMPAS